MVIEKHNQLNIISLVLSNNIWQMSTTAQNYYADGRSLKKLYREFTLADDLIAKINAIPRVIDNLESESATDALSANMGRVLKEMIDNLEIEVDDHLDINSENPVQNKVITEALTWYALLGDVNTKTFFMDWSKLPWDPDNVAVANEVLNFMNDGGKALIDYWAHTYVANKYPVESWDRRYAFYTFDTFSLSNDSVLDVKVLQFIIEAWAVTDVTLTSNSVLTIDSYLDAASNNPVANTAIVLALAGKANISYSAVEPQNPTAWDLWFNSETWEIKYYNGEDFVAMWWSDITVDDALSLESENPVQNKIITAALNNQAKIKVIDVNFNSTQQERQIKAEEIWQAFLEGYYIILKDITGWEWSAHYFALWGNYYRPENSTDRQLTFNALREMWSSVDEQTWINTITEEVIFAMHYKDSDTWDFWNSHITTNKTLPVEQALEWQTITPFMPTEAHQAASKQYVDSAIAAAAITPWTIVIDDHMDSSSENPVQNKVVKAYIDAIQLDAANVKAFKIADDQSNIQTVAADALNWFYSWKTPVIQYEWMTYIMSYCNEHDWETWPYSWQMLFVWNETNAITLTNEATFNTDRIVVINFDKDTHAITNASVSWWHNNFWFLSPHYDYSEPYEPEYDWSPATKKYVDDHMSGTAKYTVKQWSATKWIIDLTSNTDATIQLDAPAWVEVDDHLDWTSENPVQNKVIKAALDQKMDRGSVPTPNNWRLTINQGNNTWTFTADQSWNTTINLEDWWSSVVNVSNTAYWSAWRNKTNTAPSQNAVYDAIENVKSTIKTPWDWVLTLKQWAKTLWTFSADANQNKTITLDSWTTYITDTTNLWELEPWMYRIWDPNVEYPEWWKVKLYCAQVWMMDMEYEWVQYFYGHEWAMLYIQNHYYWIDPDDRNWNYYHIIDWWYFNYWYADAQRWTYRKMTLHQTDPYQLWKVSWDLTINFHESTSYSMILTWDVTLHFEVDDPNIFWITPWYVTSLLIMQDDVGWHRITFDESNVRVLKASWYAQDTTRNSISRLVLDKQDFWTCKWTSEEVRMKHAMNPWDPDYDFIGNYYFASINRYS